MFIGRLEVNGVPYVGAHADQETLQNWLRDAYNEHIRMAERAISVYTDMSEWKIKDFHELENLEQRPGAPMIALDIYQITNNIECQLVHWL
jgi:hypothetical protein